MLTQCCNVFVALGNGKGQTKIDYFVNKLFYCFIIFLDMSSR